MKRTFCPSPLTLLLAGSLLIVSPFVGQSRADDVADNTPKTSETLSETEASNFYDVRKNIEAKALRIVADKNNEGRDWDSFYRAVYLLGDMRSQKAIGFLVDRLAYLPADKPDQPGLYGSIDFDRFISTPATEFYYPCVFALLQIGDSADLTHLLEMKLANSDAPADQALCCWLLMRFKGKDAAIQLLKDFNRERPFDKQQFKLAITFMKEYKSAYGDPRPNGYVIGGPNPLLNLKKMPPPYQLSNSFLVPKEQ